MSLYLPVLMYHRVAAAGPGETKPDLFVPPETFREQMLFLAKRGFKAINPNCFAAALAGRTDVKLPERPAMITFDDADARELSPALEILNEMNFPALGYFIAGRSDSLPTPAGLEELRAAGFAIGSHGLDHRRMTELSDEELAREMTESRRRLEELSGAPVLHLAYPYGAHGAREIRAAAEAGYLTAASTRRGNRHRASDALKFKRLAVRPDTTPRVLARYLGRAWHLEHLIKELLGLEKKGGAR